MNAKQEAEMVEAAPEMGAGNAPAAPGAGGQEMAPGTAGQ